MRSSKRPAQNSAVRSKAERPPWWNEADLRTKAGWILGGWVGKALYAVLTRLGVKSMGERPLR